MVLFHFIFSEDQLFCKVVLDGPNLVAELSHWRFDFFRSRFRGSGLNWGCCLDLLLDGSGLGLGLSRGRRCIIDEGLSSIRVLATGPVADGLSPRAEEVNDRLCKIAVSLKPFGVVVLAQLKHFVSVELNLIVDFLQLVLEHIVAWS